LNKSHSISVEENVPLAPLTTLKIGGPARFFARAENEAQVVEAFEFAASRGLDVFVLGGGSNVVISDAGFDGLVVAVIPKGIDRRSAVVTAQAGEDWDEFVAFCVSQDLAGVECLSGIPGFVGGTPVQNVGAYGQDVSETIVSVRCFDRRSGEIVELDREACGFSYRKSIFNTTDRDHYVVLAVTYELVPNGEPRVSYKDLSERFVKANPTLAEVRDAVIDIRRSKSMVIDPDDLNSRSAGSFFKNPIVEASRLRAIRAAADAMSVPSFPAGEGVVKVPAAWLIEQAGLHKGYRMGNVGISSNHSLALINCGGGTAEELIALKEKIQAEVLTRFDILLEPEPVFVGFDRAKQ
jgi:UDP-N-acetylmuramate dehydrogenase